MTQWTRSGIRWGALLLLLSTFSNAPAVAGPEEEVLAAFRANDAEKLRAVAERDDPDPWLLARILCARGHGDAAAALANASAKPDLAKLPEHVKAWAAQPADAKLANTLFEIAASLQSQNWRAAASSARGMGPDHGKFAQAYAAFALGRARVKLRDAGGVSDFERAVKIARGIGWLAGEGRALFQLGWFHGVSGHHREAIGYLTENYELALRRHRESAGTLLNLGAAHGSLGDYRVAKRYFVRSLELLRKSDSRTLPLALNNTAMLHNFLGDYAVAYGYYEEALEAGTRMGNRAQVVESLDGIAMVEMRLARFDHALAHSKKAIEAAKRTNIAQLIVQTAGNRGVILEAKGDLQKALAAYEDTVAEARELDNPQLAVQVEANIGTVQLRLGNAEKALELHRAALSKLRKADMIVRSTFRIGQAQHRLGKTDVAIDQMTSALKMAENHDAGALVVLVLEGMAEAYLEQGKPSTAVSMAKRASDAMWRLVRGLSDEQGAIARQKHASLSALGIRAAMAENDPVALNVFLERGRAGALLESLHRREEIRTALVPADLRKEADRARTQLAIARREYLDARKTGKRGGIRKAKGVLNEERSRVQAIQEKIQRRLKAGAALVSPETLSLERIQELLQPGDALVSYAFANENLVALVTTARTARVVKLGAAKEIEGSLEDAAALRERLVEPLGLGDAGRVLISPDGILYKVPFVRLLGKRDVAYVPSGTIYGLLREQVRTKGEKILALGAPDYTGRKLAALPATRAEADAIGTKTLLGDEATEDRFWITLETNDRWRAVHFACHGLIDQKSPMQSALAVTARKPDDGLLTAFEIVRRHVPADLVALSACETATGKFYRGEGLLGLTRAFLFAGAPRVIVSLWDVDDDATSALMKKFYELWKKHPTARALRLAQAHVAKKRKWKDPQFWAAWQLWGLPD